MLAVLQTLRVIEQVGIINKINNKFTKNPGWKIQLGPLPRVVFFQTYVFIFVNIRTSTEFRSGMETSAIIKIV